MLTFVLGIGALFVLVLVVHPPPPLLQVGARAPALSLQDVDGHVQSPLDGSAHHAVVVEFFETTCATCQQEAAEICRIAAGNPDVTVVGVDAADEPAAAVRAFAATYATGSCPVHLLLDPKLAVSRRYEVGVVPTIYVVDSSGSIAYAGVGADGIKGVPARLESLAHGR